MAGTIAKYKIDSIASHLVEDVRVKIKELEEELETEYSEMALKLMPAKVVEAMKEHPEYFYIGNPYIYVKGTKNSHSISLKVQLPRMYNSNIPGISEEDKEYISRKVDILQDMMDSKSVLYRKSICAIEKIKTYKRLQVEFPEAYKILIEKVDKGDVKDGSICDTVESLRAELGVTEKK